MATGTTITTNGRKSILYRAYTTTPSTTEYLPPSQIKVGIDNQTPNIADTDLSNPIPIENGTVNDDGQQTMTGSNGADNTTDNTTTFKEGVSLTDDTAQNLITNATSASKTWTISNLASAGNNVIAAEPFGLWIYIKDATTLGYLASVGTAIEIKLGSDVSNFYSLTLEDGDVVVGWNWINSGSTNVEDLTETGTVSGNIDTFIIEITTNNATDSWNSADVVYDLLRQWDSADLLLDFETDYPSVDLTNLEVTMKAKITSEKAAGFNLDGIGWFNEDTSPLMTDESTITNDSKGDTDEWVVTKVNRLI